MESWQESGAEVEDQQWSYCNARCLMAHYCFYMLYYYQSLIALAEIIARAVDHHLNYHIL